MNKTKETLWKNYEEINKKIKDLEITSEKYEMLLEMRDKIMNEIIKLEQLEAEDKREKTRNIITIGTFTITTGVGVWTVLKTFRFDESSTITSTLGRNSLTNIVSKMFKR